MVTVETSHKQINISKLTTKSNPLPYTISKSQLVDKVTGNATPKGIKTPMQHSKLPAICSFL